MKLKHLQFYLFTLLFIVMIGCRQEKSSIEDSIIEKLHFENDSLKNENKLFKEKLDNSIPEYSWFNSDFDGRYFIKKEINNPEEYIKKQLIENTDIIPIKAVLGGTMSFERIQLLGKNWLIADYSDGHIYGKSLIEFHLNENNELSFKIITDETD